MRLHPPMVLMILATHAIPLSSARASRWGGVDSPEKMAKGRYSYQYKDAAAAARLSNDQMPWAETYWPNYRGGIAYRWKAKTEDSWHYRLHSHDELTHMTRDEIAELSPAEKFDIWQGRYDYPTVKRERAITHPRDANWSGLCHGWTPSSIRHREPRPKTVKNRDGIEIPMGSSDIKGLLAFYYGKVSWHPVSWTGSKCSGAGPTVGTGCEGVNAATLHLVLTNQVGRLNEGFIMDRDRYEQIWNQPFFGYEFTEQGSCDASAGNRGISIKMTAWYVNELENSQWDPEQHVDPATGWVLSNGFHVTYRYCLELDREDRIVGGQWFSKVRPGYIWNHARSDFRDHYWGRVRELLND